MKTGAFCRWTVFTCPARNLTSFNVLIATGHYKNVELYGHVKTVCKKIRGRDSELGYML